jgi:uncharacterized membrane-anchored protein YhcB (DUF1043 family)
MENMILISSITFIVGMIVGAMSNHFLRSETSKNRRLEHQLDDLQLKKTQYEAEVSDHFVQTAAILNRLNEDFQEAQTQLSKAASKLCSGTEAEQFQQLPATAKHVKIIQDKIESTEQPPLDYAPKSTDKDVGTLQEGYGLKR